MENRNSAVLGFVALCAFATVFFGFARIDSSEVGAVDFSEERQSLVQQSQFWFIRPERAGGGGMSFENLDFHRLGYASEPSNLEYNGTSGRYNISVRKPNYFILNSGNKEANGLEIDTVYFDTMP